MKLESLEVLGSGCTCGYRLHPRTSAGGMCRGKSHRRLRMQGAGDVSSSVCISCHSSRKSRQLLTCTRRSPSNAWLFSSQPEPRALTKSTSIARVICTGTGSTTAQRCGCGRTNTSVLNGFLQPHTLQRSQYQLPSMQVRAYQRSTAPNNSKNQDGLQESA